MTRKYFIVYLVKDDEGCIQAKNLVVETTKTKEQLILDYMNKGYIVLNVIKL